MQNMSAMPMGMNMNQQHVMVGRMQIIQIVYFDDFCLPAFFYLNKNQQQQRQQQVMRAQMQAQMANRPPPPEYKSMYFYLIVIIQSPGRNYRFVDPFGFVV